MASLGLVIYGIARSKQPAVLPILILPKKAMIAAPKPTYGVPTRLIIPSLKIDTAIIQVGLTADGDMESPVKLGDAGWYKYGSHPGDQGSAVIAGHVTGVKEPGVFINIHKLKNNDQILVMDDHGQTVSFTVRELRTYDQANQPKEVFRTNDGVHLNLITCAGTWQEDRQTFSDRLVVFADKSP